jgi:hypothetical protein
VIAQGRAKAEAEGATFERRILELGDSKEQRIRRA